MRMPERRLRRLEVGLWPPPETAESRRLHQVVLDIRRRRAARLGLPEPERVPARASRVRSRNEALLAHQRAAEA
jgi:hypothetical protein